MVTINNQAEVARILNVAKSYISELFNKNLIELKLKHFAKLLKASGVPEYEKITIGELMKYRDMKSFIKHLKHEYSNE